MDNASLMIVAMAEQCRHLILKSEASSADLPKALQPKHLLWMCKTIEDHAEEGSITKLHRWIGFIQCAMMANGILDLDTAKTMFNQAKAAHAEVCDDLLDHLDPTSSFELDLGGQG